MAAVPQGAFAARKVRQMKEQNFVISKMQGKYHGNGTKENQYNAKSVQHSTELSPLKYNSKLMNSIWGLYNRYSVHNFKKNSDANGGLMTAAWGVLAQANPQATTRAAAQNTKVFE